MRVSVNEMQELIVTLSDGTVLNAGKLPTQTVSYLDYYPLDDGTLGVKAGKTIYLSEVEIPAYFDGKTVTKILPNAFSDDVCLTNVYFPDTLVEICSGAFANCSSLTSVFIPESVTKIASDAFDVGVTFETNYFDAHYESDSFVKIGEEIRLNAIAHVKGRTDGALLWSSSDTSVAMVNNGVVTGISEGYVKIRVSAAERPALYFDFGVTVYDDSDEVLKTLIEANNSNIGVVKNLGIGSDSPVYYTDMIESVSKIMYNYDYVINTDYEFVQAGVSDNHGGALDGVEFITVHYTGNMSASAGATFHANYFAKGSGGTSIHYVAGNDGDGIYHILSNDTIAYHAGDGATTSSKLVWLSTGVQYGEGDPVYPVWGISSNSKYTINGKETTIAVPTGTTEATKKVTDEKWLNKMGYAYKVVNGEYYMAKTWWCYSQVAEGRLCTKGGNRTSLGIETCVNKGSDIWYTWHLTARLVANLMLEYDLPIERVVGHHFYTAKDCPQPMLDNDLELWWSFIECVQAEYDLLTAVGDYDDYEITMTLADNYSNVTDNGRINALSNGSQLIEYTLDVTDKNGVKKTVTLAALLNE